jgi:hypothetical protein
MHARNCPANSDLGAACLCDERPLAHRAASSNPWGKCEDRLDVPMPTAFLDDARVIARLNGKSAAEWARDVLCKEIVGELTYRGIPSLPGRGGPNDGTNRG